MDDRAQIAAMCLQGLLAGRQVVEREQTICIDASLDGCAALAVLAADCLLEELSKTPPPARTKDPAPPTDPGNGGTGEPEGAASPHAAEAARSTGGVVGAAAAKPEKLHGSDHAAPAGTNPASPVNVWICEAAWPEDPLCPGPAQFDPATRGRFCSFHLMQVPERHRREMHRLHGDRNRPVRLARRIAESVG